MRLNEQLSSLRKIINYRVFNSIILIILALILFGIFYQNIRPQTYDIELFSIANKTIRSPKTIIDEEKTSEEKKKAAAQVSKVYTFQTDQVQNRVSLMNSIFDFVEEAKSEDAKSANKEQSKKDNLTAEDKLLKLKENLTENVSEDVTKSISDDSFQTLLAASDDQLDHTRSVVLNNVQAVLNKKIRNNQVDAAKTTVVNQIQQSNLSKSLKLAAQELAEYAIVPNYIYDEKLTKEHRKQAMKAVEPFKILQGQVIVQEGHIIDRDIYRQLKLLGLLKTNSSIKPYIGLAIFVILIISLLAFYAAHARISQEEKQNRLVMVSLILLCSLALMKLVGAMNHLDIPGIEYAFPAAMAPMLIKILLNDRVSYLLAIIIAACASLEFHDEIADTMNVEMVLYTLLSGASGIIFLSNKNQRTGIFKTGAFIAIVNILTLCFLILIVNGQFTNREFVYYLIFAVVSGLLSSVLTMGLLPFFEASFGILSAMRLIELSNPNHPLLKKILTDAPGTYHHSLMVANLAEAACEAIGANGLLARVGSYYHDIGKTKRPQFFIENQMSIKNPHDRLNPDVSRDIIIEHTTDGADMLRKYKLPKEFVDIAEQHHGTTLLKFLYKKAKELDEHVKEEDYRYPGPKPQTREIAVINIADSVEAAVRSMNHPTPEEIKNIVHNIAQDRLLDGQLNECDITLKELEVVKKTFCETLNGIFHSRIQYPN
ncbi:HD family phosphohydrolase [Heyndrickxia ginsengihumi]|uniref:HD family phosphohydrolase n=1 Tax=Heyndrickxia ginsengihumi TaxID=363870 RepID=UPI003D1EAEB5